MYKQGTPQRSRDGYSQNWYRVDIWHTGEHDRFHCTGKDDQSPGHCTYPTGYDIRCNDCWLHHGHTEALHVQNVQHAIERASGDQKKEQA